MQISLFIPYIPAVIDAFIKVYNNRDNKIWGNRRRIAARKEYLSCASRARTVSDFR